MIKVDAVTRRYNEFVAVNQVSFEIPHGQVVGLLGHNGAGKTTLMKIITGFLEANSGTISILGKTIDDEIEYKSLIGYLPENAPSYGDLSVADYLIFSAELKNMKDKTQKIKEAIARVGLQEKVNQKISTLSKGFQQRVGVAQAIMAQPAILILDEPTNGLDPNQIHEMRALINDIAKNSTVIISTHIMQEVEAVCDRVLILNRGKLVLDQGLKEIKAGKEVALQFGGDKNTVLEIVRNLGLEVNKEDDNRLLINNTDNGEIISKLISSLVSQRIDVYGVHQTQTSLEQIFKEVTR